MPYYLIEIGISEVSTHGSAAKFNLEDPFQEDHAKMEHDVGLIGKARCNRQAEPQSNEHNVRSCPT